LAHACAAQGSATVSDRFNGSRPALIGADWRAAIRETAGFGIFQARAPCIVAVPG